MRVGQIDDVNVIANAGAIGRRVGVAENRKVLSTAHRDIEHERLFRFEFPERPGALLKFLHAIGTQWNITLFHYRNHGSDYGRVLAGVQIPPSESVDFDLHVRAALGDGQSFLSSDRIPHYSFWSEDLVRLLADSGLTLERLYGTNGIGAHIQEENLLTLMADPVRWPIWRDALLATCDRPDIVGVSRLLLAVARR